MPFGYYRHISGDASSTDNSSRMEYQGGDTVQDGPCPLYIADQDNAQDGSLMDGVKEKAAADNQGDFVMRDFKRKPDSRGDSGVDEAGTGVKAVDVCKIPLIVKDGHAKYVTVRNFKGVVYVDIRQYFEANGKFIPTKKGVMLTAREFLMITSLSSKITKAINRGQYV